MKNLFRHGGSVAVLSCLLTASSIAEADVLCVRRVVKASKRNGSVNVRRTFKTVSDNTGCGKGFVQLLGTSTPEGIPGETSAKGDKGDTGLTGEKGPEERLEMMARQLNCSLHRN